MIELSKRAVVLSNMLCTLNIRGETQEDSVILILSLIDHVYMP